MNMTGKRLLSWLCVIAMVLSFVPMIDLSNFAVETKAAEEIVYGSNNWAATGDADAIQDKIDNAAEINKLDPATVVAGTTCPMCGATDVTWAEPSTHSTYGKKLTDHGSDTSKVAKHFKIVGKVEYNYYNIHVVQGTENSTCIVLVDAEYTGTGRIRMTGTKNTLNIMGTGTWSSDGSKSENLGLFTVQGTNSTLNIYGGSYSYTGNGYGTMRKMGTVETVDGVKTDVYTDLYVYNRALLNAADATTPTINLYGGTIGGELNTETESINIYVAGGTLNMYGGTVQNGVSPAYGYAGNINVTNGATFNMYDGTVTGGQYDTKVLPASVGGNILVGAYYGTNSYKNAAGTTIKKIEIDEVSYSLYSVATAAGHFNMYGGTVTDGKSYNGGNGGGNISTLNKNCTMQLLGGTIKDGWAKAYGGNVQHQNGTATIGGTVLIKDGTAQYGGNVSINKGMTLTMNGGRLEGGKASVAGGSVHVRGVFQMEGGTIYGGNATSTANGGGNVCVYYGGSSATGTMTMSGGTIDKGTAEYRGGNIYVYGSTSAKITISGDAVISNGTATKNYGGNLAVASGATCDMTGGEIFGGHATELHAGNVLVEGSYTSKTETFTDATLNMSGNAKIYNGTAAGQAGNIRVYIGKLTMKDNAMIYGGTATKEESDNVWLVDGALEMDDNSKIYGTSGVYSSAVSSVPYRRNNTTTLKGNATVCVENGNSATVLWLGTAKHADDKVTALANNLCVDSSWTGLAYVGMGDTAYKPGDTIATDRATGTGYTGDLYYGSAMVNVWPKGDGSLYLAGNGRVDANGNASWFATGAEALAAYDIADGGYVILSDSADIEEDVVVQLGGKDLELTGRGKVYGIDSSNDDYDGYAKLTVGTGVDVQRQATLGDKQYIAVQETDGTWGFHRVDVKLTAVSLRAGQAGLYYKATYACDEVLLGYMDSLGVALGVDSIPAELAGYDYLTEYKKAEIEDKFKDHKLENVTSGSVFGIIKEDNEETVNAANLERDIHAKAYMALQLDGETVYVTSNESAWNMLEVLEKINEKFDGLKDIQKNELKEHVEIWKTWPGVTLEDTLSNVFAYDAQ